MKERKKERKKSRCEESRKKESEGREKEGKENETGKVGISKFKKEENMSKPSSLVQIYGTSVAY